VSVSAPFGTLITLRQPNHPAIYQAPSRVADWYDIRPYNPSFTGSLTAAGVLCERQKAYALSVKSPAPVAVFGKEHNALGCYPAPPNSPWT